MYITKSRSYRQIFLTVLKVIGVVSIFVAPIALLQVISASKQADSKLKNELHERIVFDPRAAESETGSAGQNIGQLGELFDVSQRKDRRDSKSILRLRRQAGDDEEQRPSLAQLTEAGTAAGVMLGEQLAAAAAAASNYDDPEQAVADSEGDESDADEATGRNLDLSTQQSLKQPAPQGGRPAFNQFVPQQQQQQQDSVDDVNPEQMPDSMESLMRPEQEDMGASQDEGEQSNEQPLASNQEAVGDQQAPTDAERDEDDSIEQNDGDTQASLLSAANLPISYLPVQGQTSDLVQSIPVGLSGNIFPNTVSSPMIDSSEDLNAAAGHHYKKKKKKVKVKKIIIKKKKKKSKKYKKLKKVKIVKYKKKKIVKKKKKPMKHHHHHHHDHGKYYM